MQLKTFFFCSDDAQQLIEFPLRSKFYCWFCENFVILLRFEECGLHLRHFHHHRHSCLVPYGINANYLFAVLKKELYNQSVKRRRRIGKSEFARSKR